MKPIPATTMQFGAFGSKCMRLHVIVIICDNNDNISLFCTLGAHTFPFKSMSGRYWKIADALKYQLFVIVCCVGHLKFKRMLCRWTSPWLVKTTIAALQKCSKPSRTDNDCWVVWSVGCAALRSISLLFGDMLRLFISDVSIRSFHPKFKWKGQLNDLMALFWDQCLGFWYLLVSRNSSNTRWGRINLAWICPPCRGPKHQHSEKPLVRLACQNQVTVFYLFILMLKFFKHLGE